MSMTSFHVGEKVYHPKHGIGAIIYTSASDISVRYEHGNVGVKFDKGGPQGFAFNATNDIRDLYASKETYEKILADKLAKEAARKVKV